MRPTSKSKFFQIFLLGIFLLCFLAPVSLKASGVQPFEEAGPTGPAGPAGSATVTGILTAATEVLWGAVPILWGISFVVFLWGMMKYVSSAGDTGKAKGGRDMMIYGTIGLFVMMTFWGIIKFVGTDVFPLEQSNSSYQGLINRVSNSAR